VGQEPDRIRAEIEHTRAEMTETVDALGHKADVPSRAKEKIVGVKDKVAGGTPDSEQVKQKARRGATVAQENPLGLALGSVAVGFVAGMLIPSTRVEDERLGEASDTMVEKVKDAGQEALQHGKQVAQDAAETAKESGREHAQRVKESAQEPAPS
jgi:gas vesicle protein